METMIWNVLGRRQHHQQQEETCSTAVQAGQEAQELFCALTGMREHYKTALTKLDDYFLLKKVVNFFQFQQASQKINETVLDHYFVTVYTN